MALVDTFKSAWTRGTLADMERMAEAGEIVWVNATPTQPDEPPEPKVEPVRRIPRPGRNRPCHCGSGKKYKNCHLRGG